MNAAPRAHARPSNVQLWSTLALVLVVVLGGCAGPASAPRGSTLPTSGSGSAGSTAPPPGPTQTELAEGSASISGLVTDTELVPIGGARVRLEPGAEVQGSTVQLSTDPLGAFKAEGLAPGLYSISVSANGYAEPKPKRVEATSDEPQNVTFTLEVLPKPVPRIDSRSFRFNEVALMCAKAVDVVNCARFRDAGFQSSDIAQGPSRKVVIVDEFTDGQLDSFIVEATWTPPLSACKGGLRTDVYSPEQVGTLPTGYAAAPARGDDNPFHWDNVPERGAYPTRLFIPREGTPAIAMHSDERTAKNGGKPILTSGSWNITMNPQPTWAAGTPVDISCEAMTSSTVWYSLFYLAPADPAWSALK